MKRDVLWLEELHDTFCTKKKKLQKFQLAPSKKKRLIKFLVQRSQAERFVMVCSHKLHQI